MKHGNSRNIEISRRSLLAGGTGLSLAACSRQKPPLEPERVSILRAEKYDQSVYEKVAQLFELQQLDVRDRNVVLKPNLVEFDSRTPINTNPLIVHAAYEALQARGARSVLIAEGPGHRRGTLDLAEAAGYYRILNSLSQNFVDLNTADVARVTIPDPFSSMSELYLPKVILGADLVVSVAKMKTHHWVGATLSMKNFFGLVPGAVYGWPKNPLHFAGIDECIADLQKVCTKTFALIDGIEGMEGNGPIQGEKRDAGVLVAGHSMPAVDATCCRIMGIDPMKMKYMQLVSGDGIVEDNIAQNGETIASVRTKFKLMEEWRHLRLAESEDTNT
jgi:uncharacterized protein (DUF362 family)